MQKVIRRTVLAEKQAARRLAKRKDKNAREWAKTRREQILFTRGDEIKDIKAARLARREDWELGPLAPRRDVGDMKDTYGTINSQRTRGQPLTKKEQEEKLKSVGGRFLNIVPGDRVVLLEGKDKGKIGEITETDRERGECKVKGLNVVDVAIPEWMISPQDLDKRPVRSIEAPVPLTSVRLVIALRDPETGIKKDVIVKELVNTRFWHDRRSNTTRWVRMIPGLNREIPWPLVKPKEYKDQPADTLRIDVENRTFVPTLLRPPMPASVIDELRNKYSVFRTRHDPEYIAAKVQEDKEKEEKKKMVEEMRTPLKEINRKERKLRRAKGKGKLTPQMLARIGAAIAKTRGLALAAAGMEKESAKKVVEA